MVTVTLTDVVQALTETGFAAVIGVSVLIWLLSYLYKRARS
jgi:hypothetical protein